MPLRHDPDRLSRFGDPGEEDASAGATQVQPNPALLAGAPPDRLSFAQGGGVEHRQSYTTTSGTHVLPQGDLPKQPPVGGA